jgi:hypothetical protein
VVPAVVTAEMATRKTRERDKDAMFVFILMILFRLIRSVERIDF